MYIVVLKKNEEKRLREGHLWIYANEVSSIEGKDKQGSVAKVVSFDRKFIGYGFINHLSKIIVRLFSFDETPINAEFFYNRIKKAVESRTELGFENNYRAVFAENDLLPGLIVDKYGDYLSVQFLSLGMDLRKEEIIDSLKKIFNPKGIYERSDSPVREKEGLKPFKGKLCGEFEPVVEIEENGLKILVDLENGQKTGYFLDQKENRADLGNYVKGKTVLDCFCNVGGFSLVALKSGAKSVTSVDVSELALNYVRKNAELNGLPQPETVMEDVFKLLREYKAQGRKFDCIILDPPAFTKSADEVKDGYRGYRDINILALKLLNKGGYLFTASCSQHISLTLFNNMLKESVEQAGVRARLIEMRTQSRDHATLIGQDEGLYLKFFILKLVD